MNSKIRLALSGLPLALLLISSNATSAPVGPFATMAGSWLGGGTLTTADGKAELLRCRASYDVQGTGTNLQLNLRCASESYNFELGGDVVYQDGRISGTWTEANHDAGGSITGRASGDHIEAAAEGQNFAANLSLTTRGNQQSVSIAAQGTDIARVTLALNRR